jgi:hypothetical protein
MGCTKQSQPNPVGGKKLRMAIKSLPATTLKAQTIRDLFKMTDKPRRPRGAPLGNRNALKHGRRSAAAVRTRKLRCASLKAIAHVGIAVGLYGGFKVRPRPLRADQLELLAEADPVLCLLLSA